MGLDCIQQKGSLPYRSTVDAALFLQHWIKEAQFAKKNMSSLFLDVKGGFNNIDHRKLLERLSENDKVPDYLADWVWNFIATRNIWLIYPHSPRRMHTINKGIPQGFPLSLLLFIIYIKPLHMTREMLEFFTTSYVPNFQITVANNTRERNAWTLQQKAAEMVVIIQSPRHSFSIGKMALRHCQWRKAQGLIGALRYNYKWSIQQDW